MFLCPSNIIRVFHSYKHIFSLGILSLINTAAVSCSADGPVLGGVKMGLGETGKLGRAWCMGRCMAWCMFMVAVVHVCVLPGLVRLDLSLGGGLDGDGDEVVGVVS